MLTHRWSMQTSLVFVVLSMGILGMVLAMFTGATYRDLAMENQRTAFSQLVKIKAEDKLNEAQKISARLGLSIQSEKKFRDAFNAQDDEEIIMMLNQNFHRYFVSTGQLKLEKLYVLDLDFNTLITSSKGENHFDRDIDLCPALLSEASSRTGASRLKPIGKMCVAPDKVLLSTLVPIGGLVLKGYLQVVIDPVQNFQLMEKELGIPMKISEINGQIVYQSERWPKTKKIEEILISSYEIKDDEGWTLLIVSLAYDIKPLHQKLTNTRLFVLIAAGTVTLLTIIFSLLLLRKTALEPLSQLARQVHLVRENTSHLKNQITIRGNSEISALAADFNAMGHELHRLYGTMEEMALTDDLTGLPNRALFYDRLNQLALMNRRENIPFALFMMDLDRFKTINDTLGHHIGDQLLAQVGTRLERAIREPDTIARLGGDEFAVLLPGILDAADASIVARRILSVMDQTIVAEGHRLSVGISVGIVLCPQHGNDSNDLLQRADVAMYHAKNNRDGYIFYQKELDKHALHNLTLEAELKQVIDSNGLELFYQPKVSLTSNKVVSVEALVRWIHPEQGFIPPDQFIPIAEKTGLIHALTCLVLKKALEQCATWHQEGRMMGVAVNLSALSLRDTGLVRLVEEALSCSGVAAEWLTLELTESAIMADPERALESLQQLNAMGISLSIDDFGTGYSSLAYLKRLPVDELKIDRSFVMEMDKNDEAIVRSTIDLAHNMGLKVIAEGIETKEVMDKLRGWGCDQGQGYFICRPLAVDDLTQWFEGN